MRYVRRSALVGLGCALLILTACVSFGTGSNYPLPYPLPPSGDGPGPIDAGTRLPAFRLPAPMPSSVAVLPRANYIKTGDTLGELADRLEAILDNAGYSDRTFFSVPRGFAIATAMERIHKTGAPFPGDDRWKVGPTGLLRLGEGFSVASLASGFVNADPGHYRILVLVVTDAMVTSTSTGMPSDEAQQLVLRGSSTLPAGFNSIPAGPGYNISVLIYEFERPSSGKPAKFSSPSVVPGRVQLLRTGIKPAF